MTGLKRKQPQTWFKTMPGPDTGERCIKTVMPVFHHIIICGIDMILKNCNVEYKFSLLTMICWVRPLCDLTLRTESCKYLFVRSLCFATTSQTFDCKVEQKWTILRCEFEISVEMQAVTCSRNLYSCNVPAIHANSNPSLLFHSRKEGESPTCD